MRRAILMLPVIALLGACADSPPVPTASGDLPGLAAVSTQSAPQTAASCEVYPHGEQYDVLVTWSRIPTTTVILVFGIRTEDGFHVDLAHPERKGTVSQTLDFPPLDAVFTNHGTQTGQQACVMISS